MGEWIEMFIHFVDQRKRYIAGCVVRAYVCNISRQFRVHWRQYFHFINFESFYFNFQSNKVCQLVVKWQI